MKSRIQVYNNITPEITGIVIELLIILYVINRWQKKEELSRKITVERRLREFLIFFLKDNFKDYPDNCQSVNFYGIEHDKNQESLDNLIANIKEHRLNEDTILRVQNYCKTEKDIFNNLIPVASDLTNDHFKSWVRVSYFMNAITAKNEKTSHAVVKTLENIKRFDDESFKSKLYVGSDKASQS